MNKWFYIAILAVLAAPLGCSRVEVVTAPQKAVSFEVGCYAPQTRAGEVKFPETESFSSRGYLHAAGFENEAPQNFFGQEGETISFTNGEWLPSHDYFWPKSASSYVNFISWCGTAPAINYVKVDEKWDAVATWSGITVGPTDKLLWADMAWRYNANVSPATYGSVSGVAQGVPTLFHHALSRIRFQAKQSKASDGNVSWTVRLTGLSLTGIQNKGSFQIENVDPEAKQTKAWTVTEWNNLDGTETLPATAITAKDLTAEVQDVLDWQNVIPQSLTESMKLTVDYTIVTNYGSTKTVEEDCTATVELNKFTVSEGEAITSWQRGKQYTYILNINPDNGIITILPVETDWQGPQEYNLNVE